MNLTGEQTEGIWPFILVRLFQVQGQEGELPLIQYLLGARYSAGSGGVFFYIKNTYTHSYNPLIRDVRN